MPQSEAERTWGSVNRTPDPRMCQPPLARRLGLEPFALAIGNACTLRPWGLDRYLGIGAPDGVSATLISPFGGQASKLRLRGLCTLGIYRGWKDRGSSRYCRGSNCGRTFQPHRSSPQAVVCSPRAAGDMRPTSQAFQCHTGGPNAVAQTLHLVLSLRAKRVPPRFQKAKRPSVLLHASTS